MSALRLLSLVVATAVLSGAPGDPAHPPGRVIAGLATASAAAPGLVPDFTLFGWVSPPVDSTNDARIAEMAEAGMTLALPALGDSADITGRAADNLHRLDLLAAHGLRGLVWDDRLARLADVDPLSDSGRAVIDTVVATYAGRPELLGWYMGDEPPASEFDLLHRIHTVFAARDPQRFTWNNLRGVSAFASRADWLAYVRAYVAQAGPHVLCDDQYDFTTTGDLGRFVENAAGLAAVGRESGLPFWVIVLDIPHLSYRRPTPGELTWQASELLAYGARGIGYFTYWTPPDGNGIVWGSGLIARDGTRGPLYPTVAALAPRLVAAGTTLAHLTWLATEHSGSCPLGGTPFSPDDWIAAVDGRAALGLFADSAGTRHVLVANSDSASARTLTLTLPHAREVSQLGAAAAWTSLAGTPVDGGLRVALPLGPGDFALLRITGDFGDLRAGGGPAVRGWPSPARGIVRLSYQGLAPGGGLEVLDAAGRRVWHATPPAGDGMALWDGARDGGGTAAPGVYFARFEDARGVAATRVVWLGR